MEEIYMIYPELNILLSEVRRIWPVCKTEKTPDQFTAPKSPRRKKYER
jgi:hypothetical protein